VLLVDLNDPNFLNFYFFYISRYYNFYFVFKGRIPTSKLKLL